MKSRFTIARLKASLGESAFIGVLAFVDIVFLQHQPVVRSVAFAVAATLILTIFRALTRREPATPGVRA